MKSTDILARIHDFPYWHYSFDLNGHQTPVSEKRINRHAQRKAYFLDPLVKLLGGSLAGKRVLDLGCNSGYWSLCALEAGCDFVVGIDAQPLNLEQAQFVFDVKDIQRERYRFEQGNVFDVDFHRFGEFDIVLCLGLLYHVNQPMQLLRKISQVNRDILIIDTRVSMLPGRLLELRDEPYTTTPSTLISADSNLVFVPSKQAVLHMTQNVGYRAVILKPKFSNYMGARNYRTGRRRAFLCARQTDLANLPAATETINTGVDIFRMGYDWVDSKFNFVQERLKAHLTHKSR
jgi:tRNA (mo5U34)-methyltransferase